ncbi:MAG: AsmA family protein [Candidatus Omnitrophica bacterium]|nr:AsmA family protein [Candidatus Omnitrophota bacterium]
MKKFFSLVLIIIILTAGAVIARDAIIKSFAEKLVFATTGMKMTIGQLKMSVPKTFVSIKDMTVMNPAGFKDRVMLDMPEVYVDYSLLSLLRKKVQLRELRINLKEFMVVKNKDGKTNLEFIKRLKDKKKSPSEQKKKPASAPGMEIDTLSLKIGKVIYKDYSGGGNPIVSEYSVNIASNYKNVNNPEDLVRIIVAKALMNTALGRLTDFNQLKDMPLNTLEQGKNILKNTADDLKNIIKSPFK